MWRLHQFPLCPFSRAVRVALGEKGVEHQLVRANPWERTDAFLALNAAGETPVLEDGAATLTESLVILEYLDEAHDRAPLLPRDPAARAEARRVAHWFAHRFFREVTAPLITERMFKRVVSRQPPDGLAIREAGRAAEVHLDHVDWLADTRGTLAGGPFGLADIVAAAQISVADYLGGIDWRGHAPAAAWYAAAKSRPSFRPLLADRQEGIRPPAHYDQLDF